MPASVTPAYVLWFGPTSLAIGRSLGRHGIPVVALHHDVNEPSVGSRYIDLRVVPPLDQDENAWLSVLMEEGRHLGSVRAPLLVVSDAAWLFVARHREALSRHFVFPLPAADNAPEWMTKTWQYAAAARAGIACPRHADVNTREELLAAAEDVAYPCVLKPALSHLWRKRFPGKLTFVRNRQELLSSGSAALDFGLSFAVQEYIPADDRDVYGFYSYADRSSRILGSCVVRKMRQFEPRFGSSCCSRSVDEPRVAALGTRLVQSIGFHGLSSVEFKHDRRDGQFKLMEINLRAPLLMAVAIDSGVDLPYIAYRDQLGDPLPPQSPTRFGRRVGIFAHDLFSARFYRRMGELSFGAWLWSWLGMRDLHFAWDDLAPFRGYMHMLYDHWKRGWLKGLPRNFPTHDEWAVGRPSANACGETPTVRAGAELSRTESST